MKSIEQIHRSSSSHWVGNGFPVRSVFDYNGLGRQLSPFLLMDYAAPHEFPPGDERRGVGAHPHKGFETVTIVYQGELEHRDSSGAGGLIGPGDVQWMTAGRGIIHDEFHSPGFTKNGGTLEMVQLWVNLRSVDKNAAPGYQTLASSEIPTVPLDGAKGKMRIIAGSFGGTSGPARTFSEMNLWDIVSTGDDRVRLPSTEGHTAALLVLEGVATFDQGREAGPGSLAVFSRTGDALEWHAKAGSRYLFLGGEPMNEPIVGHGPFVMNTADEIQQAFAEFRAGAFGDLA